MAPNTSCGKLIVCVLLISIGLIFTSTLFLRMDVLPKKVIIKGRDISLSLSKAPPTPLLLLFTTFKNSTKRDYIQTNIVKNWAGLRPDVQPLLFTTFSEGPLIELAKEHGWWIKPVPRVNKFGTPFFKDMYQVAGNMTKATFFGFANGDILFTSEMLDTLQAVATMLPQLNRTLVIGRRTNVHINITSDKPIVEDGELHYLAENHGRLAGYWAVDYFFFTHLDFPWVVVKDVVIARAGYDNYIVATARSNKMSVVDVTQTALSFHQSGGDGGHKGAGILGAGYNHNTIGRFDYGKGKISAAQYITSKDSDGKVSITRKEKRVKKSQKKVVK